jgi:hypothetical protein
MLRRVALVRTDVSEELISSFIRATGIGELGTTLAVTNNRHTLLSSSETSVLTRATRRNIPEDTILHSHRRENLKSYVMNTFCQLWDIAPWNPNVNRRFEGKYHLHLKGWKSAEQETTVKQVAMGNSAQLYVPPARWFPARVFFNPEDGGDIFLRRIDLWSDSRCYILEVDHITTISVRSWNPTSSSDST